MPILGPLGMRWPTLRERANALLGGPNPCPLPGDKVDDFLGPILCERAILVGGKTLVRRAPSEDRLEGNWWGLLDVPREVALRGYAIPYPEDQEFLARGRAPGCECRCVGLTSPTRDGIGLLPQAYFPNRRAVRIFEAGRER